MKTAVLFFYTDERYDELAKAAIDSFVKFNGEEVILYIINKDNKEQWDKELTEYEPGDELFIMQYIYAHHLMVKYKYEKVISLGCDTITCARLDEFLDNNTTDMLCTLNYPKPEGNEYWRNPIEDFGGVKDTPNINADVICFNNVNILKKVIDLSIEHYGYFSIQGGLNELYSNPSSNSEGYSIKIIDYPYHQSKVVYNARSKGVFGTNMINKDSPISRFKVKNKKLFTEDDKQIKVFHYIEGLGGRPIEDFNRLINQFKYEWFNEDTKKFFREECGVIDFFK